MATFERYQIAPTLPARDLQRARRWYQDKLGLTPSSEMPGGAGLMYPAAGHAMGFILYESEFAGTAENTAVAWAVENLDVVVNDLRSKGVRFEEYSQSDYRTDKGIASDRSGAKAAWFKDSEGNILNLTQLPAGFETNGRNGGKTSTERSLSQTSAISAGGQSSGQQGGQPSGSQAQSIGAQRSGSQPTSGQQTIGQTGGQSSGQSGGQQTGQTSQQTTGQSGGQRQIPSNPWGEESIGERKPIGSGSESSRN